MRLVCLALTGLAVLLLPAPASAQAGAYLSRFQVDWKGGGSANLNLYLPSFPVDCKLSHTDGSNTVRLFGLCRLQFLFFLTGSIDATLIFDPSTDHYSGTYSVGGGPPAILSGVQSGDGLDLDVTWPIKVNGHYKAKIYIVNDGRGHFNLKTVDPLGLHGAPTTTSDLSFTPE